MKLPSYEKLTTERGWFSMTPILSRGRHLNVITGKRSTGKSTGAALYILMDYLKTGKGWIYSRRTKDETDLTCFSWFDNAVDILREEGVDVSVEYRGGHYYVNGEEAGRAIPLSLQQKSKGDNLSAYNWIIYDEFISFDRRYLGGRENPLFEYQALMSLYQTADRGIGVAHRNEVKIIALGNSDSYYNPIYMAVGIDRYLTLETHFLAPKDEEWVVEQLRADDAMAAEDYKNSVSYKLSDERTKDYAYENIAREQTENEFVEKRNEPMDAVCNLIYDGTEMGMHFSWRDGIFYIDNNKVNKKTYALTTGDHKPAYWLAAGNNSVEEIRQLKMLYQQGRVRFSSPRVKFCIDNYLHYVI